MRRMLHRVVTCEHGGNRVPLRYRHLLTGHASILSTHRGFDAGALAMAGDLARALGASRFVSTTTRLLVDLNRSIGHRHLHSEAIGRCSEAIRRAILARYYVPYRRRVEADVREAALRGARILHVSSHSFTPVLDGDTRNADVGLLYDPSRPGEGELARRWRRALRALQPGLRVRLNYPYAGKGDGLTSHLRRRFPADVYVGIELEVNQKHVRADRRRWKALRGIVIASLRDAIAL